MKDPFFDAIIDPKLNIVHGAGGYTNNGCRCDECKAGWAAAHKDYMDRNPLQRQLAAAMQRRRYWMKKFDKVSPFSVEFTIATARLAVINTEVDSIRKAIHEHRSKQDSTDG